MNEQLNKSVIRVSPQLVSIIAAQAIRAYAETGRTVAITRYGDAPIEPFVEGKFLYKTATTQEIEKLKVHKEMRDRFDILDTTTPYTDIIVAHEYTAPKRRKSHEMTRAEYYAMQRRKQALGSVLEDTIVGLGTVLGVMIALPFVILGAVCGSDPIVYARLPSGEWLEVARFYD
jgi:hypothetical protein